MAVRLDDFLPADEVAEVITSYTIWFRLLLFKLKKKKKLNHKHKFGQTKDIASETIINFLLLLSRYLLPL
jgi:hypothetical protein